jgi:ABC-type Co2+ transport system permease subunit
MYIYSISKACNHYVEARHAIFLATILGDAATIATTSVIIGMDFLLNIYHGLKIVYLIKKKKATPSDEKSKFRITYFSLNMTSFLDSVSLSTYARRSAKLLD